MRSRLVLALLAVAACKGKSADKANESTGAGGGATNTMGSGSAVVATKPDPIGGTLEQEQQGKAGVREKGAPDTPTKVAVADGIQAAAPRGDATMERRAADGASTGSASAPSNAPAVPTPATREDGIAAAVPRADVGATAPFAILNEKALDTSTLAVATVTAKIRSAYTSGIRRCAAGKSGAVSIAFTVNETGRVAAAASTDAFDAAVGACIAEKAKYFVFPAPSAKARFAMTFQLRAP